MGITTPGNNTVFLIGRIEISEGRSSGFRSVSCSGLISWTSSSESSCTLGPLGLNMIIKCQIDANSNFPQRVCGRMVISQYECQLRLRVDGTLWKRKPFGYLPNLRQLSNQANDHFTRENWR